MLNNRRMSNNLDEFYIWGPFESRNRFDQSLWKNFHVATKFGRYRYMRKVKCLHCKKEVGWCGYNINLRKHLQRHHPEKLVEQSPSKRQEEKNNSLSDLVNEVKEKLENKHQKSFERWVPARTIAKLGGKHEVWNLFSVNIGYPRYVRCELCQREVYWNQKGLEKLINHVDKHHLNNKG
jgi:hypothetical protein